MEVSEDADDWLHTSITKSVAESTHSSTYKSQHDTQTQGHTMGNSKNSLQPSLRHLSTRNLSQSMLSTSTDPSSTLLPMKRDEISRPKSMAAPKRQLSTYLTPTQSQSSSSSQAGNSQKNASLPWCDKHAPQSLEQLAVHATKLTTLVDHLASMIRSCELNRSHQFDQPITGTRVLILTGPTGTGKSTAVRLLLGPQALINQRLPLEKFNIDLLEYQNPVQYTNQSMDEFVGGWSSTYESKLKPFLQQLQMQKYPALNILGVEPTAAGLASIQISSSQPIEAPISSTPMAPPSTQTSPPIKVLMVDDMPYLHDWRQKTDFQNAIRNWVLNSRDYNPIVFILSHAHSTDTSTAYQLFSRDILDHPAVKMIDFNPVNAQLLKRTLNNILKEERLTLTQEEMNALVETSSGDVRNAINSLQWIAENHAQIPSVATTSSSSSKGVRSRAQPTTAPITADLPQTEIMKKVSSSSSSSRSASSTKYSSATSGNSSNTSQTSHREEERYVKVKVFSSLSRDVSLSLFHSVGKIMYVKRLREGDIDDAGNVVSELRDDPTIPHTSPHFRFPLKASPDAIYASNIGYDQAGAGGGGLLLHYLHENYLKFFGSFEDALAATEYLAAADSFNSGPFREQAVLSEYAGLVAMRGIMFSNAHPKERGFTSFVKPQGLQTMRTCRDNQELMDLIYMTPNVDFESFKFQNQSASTSNNGQHVAKFARRFNYDEGKEIGSKNSILTEVVGRGELLPHQSTLPSRSQVACDILPYHGMIWREATRARMNAKYSSLLRPAERALVETLARFTIPINQGNVFNAHSFQSRGGYGGSALTLSEHGSADDSEDYESKAKEKDRKNIIMNNIMRERRAPITTLAGIGTTFNSGTSSISSSVYRRPNTAYGSATQSNAPSSSSSSMQTSSQAPPVTYTQGLTGMRIGRIGTAVPPPQTIRRAPEIIEIEDDIVDDEHWAGSK